jgi:hypothetical protein
MCFAVPNVRPTWRIVDVRYGGVSQTNEKLEKAGEQCQLSSSCVVVSNNNPEDDESTKKKRYNRHPINYRLRYFRQEFHGFECGLWYTNVPFNIIT